MPTSHEPSEPTTVGHVPPGPLPYTSYEPSAPASTGPPGPPSTSHGSDPAATAGYPASAVPTSSPPESTTTSGGHISGSKRFSPPPASPTDEMSGHYKPGDPGRENDPRTDLGREKNPSVPGDKAKGSSSSHKSPLPPSSDLRDKKRPTVFTGLDPDALALVQKLPEGDIPGVEYHIREGIVHIHLEGEKATEAATAKFLDAYKKLFAHSSRFRVEKVEIPTGRSKKEVEAEITRFEQTYSFTAFVLDEEKRVVRVICQTRQLDQAKKLLEEALQLPPTASGGASAVAGSVVIKFSHNRTLTLKKGNIVKEEADVLVNAANGKLVHGGGVAGALNSASKGELQRHCDKYMRERRGKEVPVGEVAVTQGGGKLACKHVIHVVGPDGYKHSQTQCEHLVKQAVHNTLKAAERLNATSIVLPAISCGIFGVSKDLVAHCMIDTILGFNYTKPSPILSDIRIVILDGPTHSCFACHFEEKLNPSKKIPGRSTHAHTHKIHPSKPDMNEEGKTLPIEGEHIAEDISTQLPLFFYTEVVLYPDDMSWIMPLLRRAAPKWKLILTEIGMPNDQIMSLMKRKKDEVVLLEMGVSKWLREQPRPGATLADLVKALCGMEVGEEEVASEILKGKSIR